MKTPPKISLLQLMLILLLARVMHTMIYRFDDFTSGTPIMLGLLITTAVEAVIAIPAILCCRDGEGILDALPYPRLTGLMYSLYFTVISGGTAAMFAEFLEREFSDSVSPVVAIILISAVAAYCAYLGIEGLARAGSVVFWLFVGLFVLMVIVSEGSFNWLNIRPVTSKDVPGMLNYAVESLSSAWWLPMFVILSEHLKDGAAKTAYGYLALKLIIIETLLLLVTLVLWKYVGILGYPIYALGAYAKSDFIQRFDAINMLIWAINCAIVSAVYVFIAAKPVKDKRWGVLIFAILSAGVALYEFKRGLRYNETWFLWFKLVGITVLGVVIPSVSLAVKKFRKKAALQA